MNESYVVQENRLETRKCTFTCLLLLLQRIHVGKELKNWLATRKIGLSKKRENDHYCPQTPYHPKLEINNKYKDVNVKWLSASL